MPKNITKNIFKKYMRNILVTILASILFVFCILPFLLKINFPKKYLFEVTFETIIGIISAILIFIILFCDKAKRFCQRYRNTYKLSEPPLVYPDYIFIFLFLSCLLILLFQQDLVLKTSFEFWSFLAFNIFLLVGVLFICFAKYKKKENASVTSDIISLSDEPIKLAKYDKLGRNKFIEDLYKEISCLPFNDSFVFGIHGKWGEGKTSTIYLLLERFKDNKNFIVVNFDPWYFNDEKAIISAFYGEIERTINKRFIFPNLKKAFNKYLKIVSSGLLQTGIMNNLTFGEESIEEVKQRIESYIEQIGIKLLIIVDDIDRLQAEEILLVFKLVRLNTKFKNTIFLLSFDQIAVQKVLEGNAMTDPAFLEKIVQKPVPLPAIEQNKIDEFIGSCLDKLFDEINIAKDERLKFEKELSFHYMYQTQIRRLFKTLRHAKRYINGLRSTLPPIKAEVCLYDFCILEIIRIFYPKVYDDIWNNPWYYIPIKWSRDMGLFSSPFHLSTNEDAKYEQIEEHIKEICENQKEGIVLKKLLEEIFFVEVKGSLNKQRSVYDQSCINDYRAERRITHPDSFKKYFMLKVPSSEVSDEYIKITLETWNSKEKDKKEYIIEETVFENQKKDRLKEFLNKIILFKDELSHETATAIIRVIYKKAEYFSKGDSGFLEQSEYEKALSLLLNLIIKKTDKDNIQIILEEVAEKTPDLHFAVYFVLQCIKEVKGEVNNIYGLKISDKIQDIVAGRLKIHFIDAKRDIFEELKENEWGFVLYQWSSDWMSSTGRYKDIVNNYILSLVKNNSKKFAKFLMRLREPMREGNIIFDMNTLCKAYVVGKFKELADKFQNDKSLSSEEKEAIRLFIKTPYETNEVTIQKQNIGKENNRDQ
ncbi:MAG: P-loop NTPase fold protein [Candidatus Scalinduaceae bacterium]